MRWTLTADTATKIPGDLLVVPVLQADDAADLDFVLSLARPSGSKNRGKRSGAGKHPDLRDIITRSGFAAKAESLLPVWCPGVGAGWVLLVGLGPVDELDLQTLRRAAGRAAKQAQSMQSGKLVLAVPPAADLPFDDQAFARCWCEGAELAMSLSGELKSSKKKTGKKKADTAPREWKLSAARPVNGT